LFYLFINWFLYYFIYFSFFLKVSSSTDWDELPQASHKPLSIFIDQRDSASMSSPTFSTCNNCAEATQCSNGHCSSDAVMREAQVTHQQGEAGEKVETKIKAHSDRAVDSILPSTFDKAAENTGSYNLGSFGDHIARTDFK
jgi:hypothetical protein